ncbi:MAG TPA: hypothetical protein VGP91_03005, partial [Actinoplanes sp.]|nr:hypothetical protein [Actinoplanes sp.]
FPALGPISGDWGGGHDLAEHALRYAARGEDGRGAPTALTAAVARHFNRPTVESVSVALHLGELPMSAIHELSPVLFEVAATGDPVASSLVNRQVDEILGQHRVAADRLRLRRSPHALVLGGGVLRARHPQLHDQVVAGARAQAPYVQISVVTSAPVVGAALLALDALGISARYESALRAQMNRVPTPARSVTAPVSHAGSWTRTANASRPSAREKHRADAARLDAPHIGAPRGDTPHFDGPRIDGSPFADEPSPSPPVVRRNGHPLDGRPALD